jgi:hypothetical protein
MTTYYISNDGNDANNGVTPSTPWATLSRLNTALVDSVIKIGDVILLRSDHTFDGRINGINMPDSAFGIELTIAPYGHGRKPRVSGYKNASNAAVWTEHTPGVWKMDASLATGTFTGNRMSSDANVGFLRIDGKIKPARRNSLAELAATWDSYGDTATNTVYVKASANPATLAAEVLIAVNNTGFGTNRNTKVSGLEFVGFGGHGARVTQPATNNNVSITACKIHEIGGSILSGTTRYGNGVEVWVGGKNVQIEHNDIHDVYDVGITYQGPADGNSNLGFNNVHARYNRIWNCNQTVEWWITSTAGTNPNTGYVNCSFTDNICLNAGYSFGSDVRSDSDGKGVHILTYSMELPADITVERNVFWGARHAYAFANTNSNTLVAGIKTNNNEIFLKPGTKVQWQSSQTVENAAAWVTATGHDTNSRFYTIPEGVDTVAEALEYIAGNSAFGQGQAQINSRAISDIRDRIGRVAATAATGKRSAVLTPSPGFWEHDPAYGPLTATLVQGVVYLSGAIRRVAGSTNLAMVDGNGYGMTGAIPADMLPAARHVSSGVLIQPGGATQAMVQGFIDVSNAWTELRVGAIGAPTVTNGTGRIIFDGSFYSIA